MNLRDDVSARAGGRCECTFRGCAHAGRCPSGLHGEWELHRIDSGRDFTFDNVVALCEGCGRRMRGSALGPFPGF